MGEPDIPEATPWAWSRNAGGPVILKITRSKLGRRAFGKIPMTWMSKPTGAVPWTAVSPVPATPGVMEPSGKTAGGLAHGVAAGASAKVRLTASSATETVKARRAFRREELDRALPNETTPLDWLILRLRRKRRESGSRERNVTRLDGLRQPLSADRQVRHEDPSEGGVVFHVPSKGELEGDVAREALGPQQVEELGDRQDPLVERQVRVPAPAGVVRQVHVDQAIAQAPDRLEGVEARHRGVARVQYYMGVRVEVVDRLAGMEPDPSSSPQAHGEHVLHSDARSRFAGEIWKTPIHPPPVLRLPAIGRVDHDERGPGLSGQLDGPVDLSDGIGAPYLPCYEQERCVDGPDRKAVLTRKLAENVGLLGSRVSSDHDLDAAEPRVRDVAERFAERPAEEAGGRADQDRSLGVRFDLHGRGFYRRGARGPRMLLPPCGPSRWRPP